MRHYLVVVLLLFCGCGLWTSEESPPYTASDFREPPIDVSVGETMFSQNGLKVEVQLQPRTTLATDNIALGLFGLAAGEQVDQQVLLLKDVLDDNVLEAGETYNIPLQLASTAITDYQVKCSWGEDVQRLIPEIDTPANTLVAPVQSSETEFIVSGEPGLLLTSVQIEKEELPCDNSPCDQIFHVTAELMNNTPTSVFDIRLALGLYWVNEGQEKTFPSSGAPLENNEEEMMLAEVSLKPGEGKKVRVKVDRAVPSVPGGSFQPHLRILSYEGPES